MRVMEILDDTIDMAIIVLAEIIIPVIVFVKLHFWIKKKKNTPKEEPTTPHVTIRLEDELFDKSDEYALDEFLSYKENEKNNLPYIGDEGRK